MCACMCVCMCVGCMSVLCGWCMYVDVCIYVCVHVCEWVVSCMCMGVCMHEHLHSEGREKRQVSCFITLCLVALIAHQTWSSADKQQAPGIPLSLPSTALELETSMTCHMSARDLNSGPHVCIASRLTHWAISRLLSKHFLQVKL